MATKAFPLKCRILAAATKNEPTRVDIYDDIGGGDGFFGPQGISAQDFTAQIKDLKGDLEIHINSGGGDVFEGIAISNAISGYRGKVTTIVDGIAASIASIIMQAGKERKIRSGAMVMIHDAFGGCVGNAREMEAMAGTLNKISDNLADIYAKRSRKGTQDSWRASMRDETWYTAEEAVVAGLADGIDEHNAEMPSNLDVNLFAHVPDRIAARLTQMPKLRSMINKAMAVHHTSTVDKPWDGGAAKKGMPNKANVLQYCYAWENTADSSEGAEDKKKNYKFPHHMTNGGPANLSACRNGLARLAGSNIPDADKAGVEAHLRAHLKDGGSGDAENDLKYFINRYSKSGPLAVVDLFPSRAADRSKWNSDKAIRKALKAKNPADYFAAICAGHKTGDPNLASSWALPYRYAPNGEPNVNAIMEALARIPVEKDLTNAHQAREFLTNLMIEIDPNFKDEDVIDPHLLSAALLEGLKGA